jgi:polyphosphate kinase
LNLTDSSHPETFVGTAISLDHDSSSNYFNREITDLAFIERVLDEASNLEHPLLEQLSFLSISASILDQFYSVRVARLRRRLDQGDTQSSIDGLTPYEQLRKVNEYADYLLAAQQKTWVQVHSRLQKHGISLAFPSDISRAELNFLDEHFHKHLMPILSPFMIDREHPFPYIPSGGICIVAEGKTKAGHQTRLLVPLPPSVPRFSVLPGDSTRIIALESIITRFIQSFFTDVEITSCGAFQILRDNDLAIAERFDDLREMVETGLEQRERANVIRLKFIDSMTESARRFVAEELGILSEDEIEELKQNNRSVTSSPQVAVDVLIGLSDALHLISTSLAPDFPHLAFPSYRPVTPERIRKSKGDYFSVIRERDLMLHWPYDSFDVLTDFIQKAAVDPDVTAIKQTLYRTSDKSPIVNALIAAAESGKAVVAVVELEARDNERANVLLAKRMEASGVQIVYGIVDLKVHCKMTLIVRREEDETELYTHLGTGNYHPGSAKTYTDLAYFSCDKKLTNDVNKVFNYLTSGSFPSCNALSVAPRNLRNDLLTHIEQEIGNALQNRPAAIWAKLNALTDPIIIDKLYAASQAGVNIELVVRRQCRLKPGIPGLSENIRVKSIVGRFLEHSRIYCFANGAALPHAEAKVYISSADWMERNFDDRVEIMIPVNDRIVHQQVLDDVLCKNIEDTDQSWTLASNGSYQRQSASGISVQQQSIDGQTRSGKS